MNAKVTRIAGDKRINEVMELMKAMSDDGCAVVLNKAKEMVREYPRQTNGKLACVISMAERRAAR